MKKTVENHLRTLGLYIHIPFCRKKCRYCDFLSGPAALSEQMDYLRTICMEIKKQAECLQRSGKQYCVDSIFFGGGTPSILPGAAIEAILTVIRTGFVVTADAEISIECNPGTLDAEKLAAYRRAGINRISMGVQSADDAELRTLGRIHTWERVLESVALVREAGFTNLNLDLMDGLPGQTAESFAETLTKVLSLHPEHLSVYNLIIEEGTPFFDEADTLKLPSEDELLRMDELTGKVLARTGYEAYEISNYAKPGLECRHNLKYWQYEEYLGFGLGAASLMREDCGLDFSHVRTEDTCQTPGIAEPYRTMDGLKQPSGYVRMKNCTNLETYRKSVYETQEWRLQECSFLMLAESIEEYVFLGLRMKRGISASEFEIRFGVSFASLYQDKIARYQEQNLFTWEYDRLALSEEGMEVSNPILADFLLTEPGEEQDEGNDERRDQ